MRNRTLLACAFYASTAWGAYEDAARKVLASRCWACHGQSAVASLRLDSREAMLRGGKSGPALVPGKAALSRIFQMVERGAMPPGSPLTPDEKGAIERWINEGAQWTATEGVHWSFLPLKRSSGSIDGLIAAAQQSKRLTANPRADKHTLIRRAYFDLIGLPPEPDEYAAAVNDESDAWFGHLMDRLLASPHFGEKWGRHWLDVARYGEDDFSGTAVIPYPNAWRYRDWVVQAINADMPYDRLVMAQLAGDMMHDDSLLPATGLMGLGPWYYGIAQPPQSRADERHDRVDMVTRGLLGVTVACARCHDHKYDPILQRDYYALAGVFASTAYKEYPLVPASEVTAWNERKKSMDTAEKALNDFLDEQGTQLSQRYAPHIATYMMATVKKRDGLDEKVLKRWKEYLAKPEENHPFLARWFAGQRTKGEAKRFEKLILQIVAEKKALDKENKALVEEAKKTEPKVEREIVLPGGYRSEADFNPGAYISSKSLDRNRFVAWNRTFGEYGAPLKFTRELTPELLSPERKPEYDELKANFEGLKKALGPQYPFLHGSGEFTPEDLRLNLRGNPESLGDVVPRAFPAVLSNGRSLRFDQGSGRLQLADAVAHHPLAARVRANRIWLALFGQGLVRTPSNFGRMGDRPAMPEVLEYLAGRLVESGYSVKAIVREVMLSEAYQRSSAASPVNEGADAGNLYCWRQNRRRLEAESWRDAMLVVSGELDRNVGGESKPLDAAFHRRTLYAKSGRFQPDETLSLFDLPSASGTCEQRVVTNVPLQKLFVLNSDTVSARAAALAKRVQPGDVEGAYQLLFFRPPTAREKELAANFLKQGNWTQYTQVLLASNEFAYVD